MSDVKRYAFQCHRRPFGMETVTFGNYVHHEDYPALRVDRDQIRDKLALIEGQEPFKSAGAAWLHSQQRTKYGDESEAEEAFLAGYMAALSAAEALNEGR